MHGCSIQMVEPPCVHVNVRTSSSGEREVNGNDSQQECM